MTNILSGSRMSHQCLDTSFVGTPHIMKCCSKEHLCIYRHIYIYNVCMCIYIYIVCIIFFCISNTYTSTIIYIQNLRLLTQSTSRSRAPWHLADLLLGGVPGQAEHVLGDEKNGDLRDSKQGKPWENHKKTMGKTRESMGEMGFSPKTMEKRWKRLWFLTKTQRRLTKKSRAWPQTVRNWGSTN